MTGTVEAPRSSDDVVEAQGYTCWITSNIDTNKYETQLQIQEAG